MTVNKGAHESKYIYIYIWDIKDKIKTFFLFWSTKLNHSSYNFTSFKKPLKIRALHKEEVLYCLCNFSIAPKASSPKILLWSWKQMEVSLCKIRTVRQMPTKSCNIECGLATIIQQQNGNVRRQNCFFWIFFFNFNRI